MSPLRPSPRNYATFRQPSTQSLPQSLSTRIPTFQPHIHLHSTRLTSSFQYTHVTATPLPTFPHYAAPTLNPVPLSTPPHQTPHVQPPYSPSQKSFNTQCSLHSSTLKSTYPHYVPPTINPVPPSIPPHQTPHVQPPSSPSQKSFSTQCSFYSCTLQSTYPRYAPQTLKPVPPSVPPHHKPDEPPPHSLPSTRLTLSTHCTDVTATLLPTYPRNVPPNINRLPTSIPPHQNPQVPPPHSLLQYSFNIQFSLHSCYRYALPHVPTLRSANPQPSSSAIPSPP